MTKPKLTRKHFERWKDIIRWAWDADVPFSMSDYRKSDWENPVCDTVACFLGHSTRFSEKWNVEVPRFPALRIDFNRFGKAVLGVKDENDWCWLFSGHWRDVDNTLRGAAQRAIYWLRHGAPDDGRSQMAGHVPLCYKGETLEGLEDV